MLEWIKSNPDRAAMAALALLNLVGGLVSQFSPRAAQIFRAAGPDLVSLFRACLPAKKVDE